MKCDRCGRRDEDLRDHLGQELCEDCYMDALSPAKACDPWATYTAKRLNAQETDLNPAQQAILAGLADGPVEAGRLRAELGLDPATFSRETAALRHVEKIRGFPCRGEKWLILFNRPNPDWADV